jgi:gliding motility-associated-like protein
MKTFLSTKLTVRYVIFSFLLMVISAFFLLSDEKTVVSCSSVKTTGAIKPDLTSAPGPEKNISLTKEEKEKKKAKAKEQLQKMEVSFRKNMGQWEEQILYKGKNSGINLSFMKAGLSYGFGRGEGKKYEQLVWNEYFDGMNEEVNISEENRSNSSISYIIGTEEGKNKTFANVPDFNEITYRNVYNNIDVKYYANQSSGSELEKDFILKPGSDINNIRIRFDGIKGLSVDKKGILSVKNAWGTLREYIPSSYQIINGKKKEINVKYKLNDLNCYGFDICGIYDPSKDLVIDPVVLDWATFAGPKNIGPGQPGFTGEEKQAVLNDLVVDQAGNTYATGWSQTSFPTTVGAFQTGNAGQYDVMVFKLNPAATALVWGTYIGTTNGGAITDMTGEIGWGINIDAAKNVFVTGSTDRSTFPTTAGAYKTTFTGPLAAFVVKLNPTGTGLVYSTFLGTDAEGRSVEVLSTGEAIVGGYTAAGFPTTAGAFQTTLGGGRDGFISKLNAAGSALIYSTYVGGSANDTVYRITIDAAANTYASGTTSSGNFPTAGPYQATLKGITDAFLFKLNTAGSALVYSTYFGGTSAEEAYGVDVNSAGEAYICGGTASTNMPTVAPSQAATVGKGDAFIAKFNASGSGLIYSTYLGGTQDDVAWDIVVDCNDEAFVCGHSRIIAKGQTNSANFPVTTCGYSDLINANTSASPVGCNSFISKYSPSGKLIYSGTKWSGAAYELRTAMDLVEVNCCVQGMVCGGTTGHIVPGYDFITTPGTFEETDPRWTKFSTPWVYRLSPKPNTVLNVTTGTCLAKRILTVTMDTCFGNPTVNWKFGDGTTGTGYPITHTYTSVGTYTVTMVASCPHDSLTKTITITDVTPCGPSVTAVGGPVCPGSCYSLTATSTAGTSPYTYSWNPGAGTGSSFSACPSSTTTYTVTTTDNAGVTASNTAKIIVNSAPTASITGTTTICAGMSTTLTAAGGGTYLWNNGATTTSITVSPASLSSYSVTATNASGCTGTAGVTVTVTPNPIPTVNGATICAGTSATLTATGGGSYSWNTGLTTSAITVTPAINTTYTVTVTNIGCTGSATSAVTVAANLIPVITGVTTICSGTGTTLSTSGGGTYIWNDGSTTSSITVSPTVNPTNYSVTVTNGSCSGTATVQVTVNPLPTPTVAGTSICVGNSATLTASGGSTYVWNNGATTTSITVTPATATTYTVTATTSGCAGSTTAVVNITPPPNPTITGNTAICIGSSTTLTATGGGTYAWSTGDLTAGITVSPNVTTTYTVTVTTGCSASTTVVVTVQANLTPTITGLSPICNGSSTTLTTKGGGTYAWNDGTTNASITVSPTTLTSYSVTVTNGLCSGTASVQVSVINNPTPTITGNTNICPNTSTILTANGGGTYVWNTGATTTSITVSPAIATTYTVTATSASGGCTGQTTVVVNITPPPVPAITGNLAICIGSSTTLTATGGGTYAWSTGALTAPITVSPTATSTYTVTVTNVCTASATVQVTVQTALIAIITGPNSICNGTGTTLTTSGGGTYAWNDGSTGPSITVSPSSNTTYSVTVTNGLCSGTASRPVTVIPNPTPVITGTTTICSGTGTTLTANAGGTYAWNNGTLTAAITVSPTVNTTYSVIVTTNGCTGTASVGVTVNPTPAPVIPGPTTICTGQGTTLTSSTSGPYIWSTGATTGSITVSPTVTTSYSVSVTVNGCTGTGGQVITVIPPVIASLKGKNICLGQSVTLTAGGGSNYLWNTGATSNPLTDNPTVTTTYTVIASVGNCADTATYTVTVSPLPTVTASGDTTISYGGTAFLKSTGSGTYTWTPSTGLSCTGCPNPIATPMATTQYCVFVTNAAGCADSSCVLVRIDTKCGDNGELFVPNGFSPNADNENDVLYVYGGGVTGMYWAIYDRWGERVFETTNPKQGWDGTYKGKQLDPAVFVYYLKITCFSGDEIIQKGNVAIIK